MLSYLWDPYQVVRDTQNFYWMARAQDPTLFSTDYLYISGNALLEINISEFHFILHRRSPGYGLLFYLASTVLDFVWLTKLSIWLLVTLCTIYLFNIGRFLRDNLTGVSLSLLFIFFILASPLSISIVSGLQRAFALPLFIVFLYYLIKQQHIWSAVLIFISALIYLPNFPPMVLTYGLSFIMFDRPFKVTLSVSWARLIPLAVALLLSTVVIVLALADHLGLVPPNPPLFSMSETSIALPVTQNPAYQTGGRTPLYIGFPFLGRAGIFDTGGDVANFLVLLILGFLIYKTIGRDSLRRMPKEIWYLVAAGFIMYLISLAVIFGFNSFALYLPSRYTRTTLLLAALFFVGLNWVDFLHTFPRWLWRNRRLIIFFLISFGLALGSVYLFSSDRRLLIPTFWFIGLIFSGVLVPLGGSAIFWLVLGQSPLTGAARWLTLLVVGGLTLYLGTIYIDVLGVKTTNPPPEERAVYRFVASLPKDTVLAGDPDLMTNIPLFSKRSVLFRELFPRPDAPIADYFDIQYSESLPPVLDFCQRYQISYLVLDTREFEQDYLVQGRFFYQPWNDVIVSTVAGRSNFALLQVQPTFTSGPYTVIKCDAETLLATGRN